MVCYLEKKLQRAMLGFALQAQQEGFELRWKKAGNEIQVMEEMMERWMRL